MQRVFARLVVVTAITLPFVVTVAGATPRALTAAGRTTRTITETLSISFISPSLGWRVAQRWNEETGAQGAISVGQTSDGGAHWRTLATGRGLPAAHILFADPQNGWLYGSRLYATHDGGRTWRRVSLYGSQTTLSVVGSSVWRIDSACRSSTSRCQLSLWTSVAGRSTWHLRSHPPVEPAIGWSIARANADVAWVTGRAGPRANSMRLTFIVTTDGGRTWRRLPMPCNDTGFGALYADIVPYTPTNLWLFCASEPGAGSQAKAVFRSSDGGHTWQIVARSSIFGDTRGDVGTMTGVGYLNDAAVTSSRDAWVALSRDTLVRTVDGGRTWHAAIPINMADPGGGGVGPVEFIDPRHGWLLSFPTLLFRTSDGGRHWLRMPSR